MARRGFAALLGADAANDDPTDAVGVQPHIQARADQGAVTRLVENRIRLDGERREGSDQPGRFGKSEIAIAVKNLHDGNASVFCAIDQRL